MDYLRSCYTAEVRYLAGSQARGYITWEKAQPGAQVYPYPHAFSSSVWENNDPSSFGPIGETSMARTWSPTKVSPFDGKHNDLDPQIALHGIPISALTAPPPARYYNLILVTSTGGIVTGGLAIAQRVRQPNCCPGLLTGGVAVAIPISAWVLSRGGVVTGGEAGLYPEAPVVSMGGILTGGAGSVYPAQVGAGGVLTGGAGLIILTSAGGVLAGGSATITHVQIVQPFNPSDTAGILTYRASVGMTGTVGYIR